jgi:hypothetical protein
MSVRKRLLLLIQLELGLGLESLAHLVILQFSTQLLLARVSTIFIIVLPVNVAVQMDSKLKL